MVGKTFKGLTDELLRWQTETFPEHAVSDNGWELMMRPEVVVERTPEVSVKLGREL